jgi:hypothetical protein
MIPNISDSRLCEDQPTREAGVGLLASGQARKSPPLNGSVRVAPRRDGYTMNEKTPRRSSHRGATMAWLTGPSRASEDIIYVNY